MRTCNYSILLKTNKKKEYFPTHNESLRRSCGSGKPPKYRVFVRIQLSSRPVGRPAVGGERLLRRLNRSIYFGVGVLTRQTTWSSNYTEFCLESLE